MRSRLWTIEEVELLCHAWGPSQLWTIPSRVWDDGQPARVEFDTEDPKGTLKVFIPEGATDAAKVHEAGHAIHLALYPESVNWSDLKCETFAMIGVVRMKLDGPYGDRPDVFAAKDLLEREPLRYDRVMKLAAELDL